MNIYVAQDWHGNVYVTDNRDHLPPDATDFSECYLPEKTRHTDVPSLTLVFEEWSFEKEVDLG